MSLPWLKRISVFAFFLLWLSPGSKAQDSTVKGDIYAIIVGISHYHYIKPLSYADSDAELFSDLLRSGVTGKIRPENLFLLKNDSANAGNFWSALSRLSNRTLKKGDRVYIFFAGHGDAVKGVNEYYLLLSDCQPGNDGNNYLMSFGAIDMYHLKNRMGLLTSRGVEVILILDACRTNELAGGYASQAFNTSILQAKVGEITMLATSPGQVSIENDNFGNGHGLFTYNLVDAFSGRADNEGSGNKDRQITFSELQQWVSLQVKEMAGKFKTEQSPVFCCEDQNKTVIGTVDSSFMSAWNLKKQISNNSPLFPLPKSPRSFEAIDDTAFIRLYHLFTDARKLNNLWGEGSANSLYDQMHARFPGNPLTEDARYALASDFINFAQQKINLYLEGKDMLSLEVMRAAGDTVANPDFLEDEFRKMQKTISEKWTIAGKMIQKAGLLLSSPGDSSMLEKLKPKIYFLLARGYLNNEKENELNYDQALRLALEGYRLDSTAAYAAEGLGLLYIYKKSLEYQQRTDPHSGYSPDRVFNTDTTMRYFRKAISLAPAWPGPYKSIALKTFSYDAVDSSLIYLRNAIVLGSREPGNYISVGDFLKYTPPQYADTAVRYYKMALALSPKSTWPGIYSKIAGIFFRYPFRNITTSDGRVVAFPKMNRDSVEWYSNKALALDPGNIAALNNLARVLYKVKQLDSALNIYKAILALSPTDPYTYYMINSIYEDKKMPDSGIYYCRKLLSADPGNGFASFQLAEYFDYRKKNLDSAYYYYTQANDANYASKYCLERLGFIIMRLDKKDTRPLEYFTWISKLPGEGWKPLYNIVCYYSNHGDEQKALEYLEMVILKGMRVVKVLKTDHWLDPIRESEGYKSLLKKYNLE